MPDDRPFTHVQQPQPPEGPYLPDRPYPECAVDTGAWWVVARTAAEQDPNYVNIGNSELIDRRANRQVPIPPGGTLNDYVPFCFTPFSIMMLNIKTGYNGINKRSNEEIVIFVSSIHRLEQQGLPNVYTNGHAHMAEAEFYRTTESLDHIDWPLLQRRDFKRDPNDFSKQFRYQAEALVHHHVPLDSLVGIACFNERSRNELQANSEQMSTKS